MVWIHPTSPLSQTPSPTAYHWDSTVRQHHAKYQHLIDGLTYQLQRTQRLILKLTYPRYYFNDVKRLQLLKKKQDVGQVTQAQVDLYKNIDEDIAEHFNRTFSSRLPRPTYGLLFGGALFAYSTFFNFSIPTRFAVFAVPVFLDLIRVTSDPINENKTSQFLDWVIGYRKAKCFAQRNETRFNSQKTRKVLGDSNLISLGQQLVALTELGY